MLSVCLDTQIIVWAIKEEASPGQESQINKAKFLLEELNKNKANIIIPSIVVAEFLTGFPLEEHADAIEMINEFYIAEFDLMSGAIYAKMWREKKEKGALKDLKEQYAATRQELKADCMIVATAYNNKVDRIYSEDRKLRKFAEGYIEAFPIPTDHDLQNQQLFSFITKGNKDF